MVVQDELNEILRQHNVEVKFSKNALSDYKSYPEGSRKLIVALIVRQATKKNPLLRPGGHGEPLHDNLAGFAKIKPKALSMRIVYRPRQLENGVIRMEIIAIGPKDKEKVYQLAARRLSVFIEEMEKVSPDSCQAQQP